MSFSIELFLRLNQNFAVEVF